MAMRKGRIRRAVVPLAIAGTAALSIPAWAFPISQTLEINPRFLALEQSYFGPGRIEGVADQSGSVGGSGLGANFFASAGSGTVTGLIKSSVDVTAPTLVRGRRKFDVDFEWLKTEFSGSTTFLAGFEMNLFFLGITVPIVDRTVGMSWEVDSVSIPPGPIGLNASPVGDCESITAVSIGAPPPLDPLASASIGGRLCVTQRSRFELLAIDGTLLASQDGQPDLAFDFRLSSVEETLPIALPSNGTWEFTFEGFGLEDRFGTRLVYEAGAFGEICFLLFCDDRDLLEEIADVDSEDFPLTWATAVPVEKPGFEVTIAIPEPGILLDSGSGCFANPGRNTMSSSCRCTRRAGPRAGRRRRRRPRWRCAPPSSRVTMPRR
jgi:hypothetical protein